MIRWYQGRWWYVESPFPWLGIAVAAVPILLLAFGVVVGLCYAR